VSILVGGVKGTPLRFVNQTYNVHIAENSRPDSHVIAVSVKSSSVTAGNNHVVYSFANGNEDGTFHINQDTGLITVNDPAKLDFETNSRLRLIVIATAGSVFDYTTVWVDLRDANDNAPRFELDRYTSAVWEGLEKGTYVTQVIATDLDSGLNGRVRSAI